MAINDERYQMIEHNVTLRPDAVAADAVLLWKRLAAELIVIIGSNGFETLYSRSIHLAWMRHASLPEAVDPGFELLESSLENMAPAAAAVAACDLLTTFTDTLSRLIGEPLTTAILKSAWSRETAGNAAKEMNNEQ